MAETSSPPGADEAEWRQRAVARSLNSARSRAEQRIQRFLDAAFALMDEKGSTEFTIQEVIDRSKQSMRGFYQYFDGKDELLLALFEETVREATEDLRGVIGSKVDPLERLHDFTIRLHEWCEPVGERKRGTHNRRPINEFSVQLAVTHPDIRDTGRITQVRNHVPGELSMWFFVIGDLLIFGVYFIGYIYYRGQDADHGQ